MLHSLPKVELHRHLEGSVRLETLLEVAHEHGIIMPEYNVATLRPFVQVTPEQPRTSRNFLAKFQTLRQFYRSPEVIQRVSREAVADAAADQVRYLELRFTPQALANIMHCDYSEVVGWVCDAALSEARKHNIQVGLLVSMNRHEGAKIGARVLRAALDYHGRGVVGIDLAGQELGFGVSPFVSLFRLAREVGLYTTVHAGEWDGPESLRSVLDLLKPHRIGHGVRALEDPEVLARVVDQQIPLEVCPTSNYDSGVVDIDQAHPIEALVRAGAFVTLNTDDPLVSNITLTHEIERAMQAYQWDVATIAPLSCRRLNVSNWWRALWGGINQIGLDKCWHLETCAFT
jgi:adenosine deaminase